MTVFATFAIVIRIKFSNSALYFYMTHSYSWYNVAKSNPFKDRDVFVI